MQNSKSNYLKNKVVEHILYSTTFTKPANKYLALFITNPTETGTAGTEVSGGSYARKSLTFGAAANGVVVTTNSLSYTNMPSCTISYWAIFDAVTGGNMLYYGIFDVATVVASGATVTINAGSVKIGEM